MSVFRCQPFALQAPDKVTVQRVTMTVLDGGQAAGLEATYLIEDEIIHNLNPVS